MPQQYNGFTPDITQDYSGFTPDDPEDDDFGSGYGLPKLRDIGVTALKGFKGAADSILGLADIVTSPLGEYSFGDMMKKYAGYDPKVLSSWLEQFESPELQAASKEFGAAKGFGDSASALWRNPGLAALTLEEAIPSMYGGAAIGRGALSTIPKLGRLGGAAFGEGAVGAGSQASQIRGETGDLSPIQALIAAGSGGVTGAITAGSGRVARKFGLPDIDEWLIDPNRQGIRKIPSLFGSGINEAGEEFLQSGQEQGSLNLATGKPIGQGVRPAATMGALVGFGMGSILPTLGRNTNPEVPSFLQPGQGELSPTPEFVNLPPFLQSLSNPPAALPSDDLPAFLRSVEGPSNELPSFLQPSVPSVDLSQQQSEGINISIGGQPNIIPEGSSLSDDQQTVTLTAPSAGLVSYWRSKGYQSAGVDPQTGHPQMVRGAAPAPVAQPPAEGGSVTLGAPVIDVPSRNVTNTLIESLQENGYTLDKVGPTVTTFKRIPQSEKGEVDFTFIANKLRNLLGREPSQQEIEQEAFRARADSPPPIGQTGLVAPFDRGFEVDETHPANNMPPVDPAKLQAFRDSFGDRPPLVSDETLENAQNHAELFNRIRTGMATQGMDPRMAARVEAGGPREFDFTQPHPQQGQFPMEMRENNQLARIADADLNRIQANNEANLLARTPMSEPNQESMIPQMSDEEIRRYLLQEDATPPEMRDLNEFDPNNEPTFARVEGGGLTASVNIKRAVENITRDYTSPIAAIMNREGMQNALDASDKLGEDGEVRVRFNGGEQSIEISDNGSGLDEEGLSTKLVEIFATGKEGEAGATGGKGIGSASYIYGGEFFQVDSIAIDRNDGQKYRIIASGTPEQFLDPVTGSDWSKESVPQDTPTGTTIRVVLKDGQSLGDSRTMLENIVKFSRNRPSRVLVDNYAASYNEELKDADPVSGNFNEHKFASSSDDKVVGDFTTVNRNSDVKILIPPDVPTASGVPRITSTSYIKVHYLNNGMYQFSEDLHIGEAEGAPPDVIVDIHPLVDDLNDLYPFINTREDIKKDIRAEVSEFIKKHVADPAVSKRKNRIQELYDSMNFISGLGTQRKAVIFDPGNRLTQREVDFLTNDPTVRQLVQLYDKALEDILISVGRQKWIDRVEGIGIVMDPTMHGVHIPNPATKKSTILINPFIRIGAMNPKQAAWNGTITILHEAAHIGNETGTPIQLTSRDLQDPRLGEFLSSYMNQLVEHGDISLWRDTGHGMGFAHRLGEVYAKYGVDATYRAAAAIEAIYTGDRFKSGSYSPEIQRLLQLYQDSRGRAATTEDLLSGTGVKQANRGRGGAGGVPGNNQANGAGTTQINWVKEALAVPTNATTMLDLSAPGRQGLTMILTPEFWKAIPRMFGALNYDTYKVIDNNLKSKPIMQDKIDLTTGKVVPSFAKQIGVKFFSPASEPGPRAEATASKWLEVGIGQGPLSKAWKHTAGYPIRATNRAFVTFLNHLNVNRTEKLLNLARDMSATAESTGRGRHPGLLGTGGLLTKSYTPAEAQELDPYKNLVLAKEIAEFVNAATGHGTARNSLEKAIQAVGPVLFSPGLLISRVRMMNPVTYVMASPFVRRQYTKAALSTAAAWYVMAQLIKNAAGEEAEIGDDPTSADFGKIRVGDARLDVGGGFQQFVVAYARLWAGGSTSSASNEFHRFGSGYQAQTQEDMMQRFFVNKLNPASKFAYDILSASEYNQFHVGDRVAQLFVPLFIQDLRELTKEDSEILPGAAKLFATAAFFGGGTQNYSKGESVSKFVDPENDWNVTGGGLRDLMPWNWNGENQPRNFPWSEPE